MGGGTVFDTSVLINLLGCGAVERVLKAIPGIRVVAEGTSREVLRHPLDPTSRTDPVAPLLSAGLLQKIASETQALTTFMRLVSAAPPDGLGDGEAAAIALAQQLELAIALDDQKARRIVRQQFPRLRLVSSVELFSAPEVATALGDDLVDVVFSALINARMRVLPENERWVLLLLGDRAAECPSLKKRKK